MSHCQRRISARKGHMVALALMALAACAPTPVMQRPMAPPPRIDAPPPVASAESQAMRAYYANVQSDLLAQGLMRTDGGGQDAPFTDRMLAENFIRVALFDEYQHSGAGLVARETVSRLRRWEVPVRVGLHFGASVPPERRAIDTAQVSSYLARMARLTGHPIALADSASNFQIYIVNEDERRALGPVIAATLPDLAPMDVAGLTNLPRSTYCIVYALSKGNSAAYTRAFAVIRAEHPDLLRLSCMHEEIAQGLGLANDSPTARPSIFNDDEEYALLTRQDELMLRLLYSPSLRPGMSEPEARPIIFSLASMLMAGAS
ncbi:DUF2927 domain-containing protein [Rhodobacter ferrooxidans]|uniref:Putative lipoprotein n=1 Tax=Rhodobacter ferrooxidans TaxID=371731 RepID=C8RXP2_9RHOB|nr:DUF2927 domain-containing protein [Rhodobacter sp. SW2]EEW26290.1 putative lipoprotein [Rhodobacter sp. SW2]